MSGDFPAGPSSGMINSMMQSSMAGQSAGAQFRLCGILPQLGFDSHPFSINAAGLAFLNKNVLPGQGGLLDVLFPSTSGGAKAKLMDKLFAFLKSNGNITSMADIMNHAHDLTPEQLRQLASITELHGSDVPVSFLSQLSAGNAAMHLSAIRGHDDGMSI